MDFVQSHIAAVTPPKHLITTIAVWEGAGRLSLITGLASLGSLVF